MNKYFRDGGQGGQRGIKPATSASSGGGGGGGGGGIHSAGGGRRPVKIWNAARTVRKALVVSTYEEFHRKGREKLGLGKVEPIRVVLESDGTQVHTTNNCKLMRILGSLALRRTRKKKSRHKCFQVDDGEYFQTLPENSVFIFLRSGEIWRPEGTDAVRAGKLDKTYYT